MTRLNAYGFRGNPFPLTPEETVTHWAGRKDIRHRMRDIVSSVLATDTGLSEFVLLVGPYGGGKTHAMRYFSNLINETEKESFKALAIYIPKLQVSPEIGFLSLYFQIARRLGYSFFKELGRKVRENTKVPGPLDRDFSPMIRLLLELEAGNDKVFDYLSDGKPVIEASGFDRPIDSDFMAIWALSDLIGAMTVPIGNAGPIYNAVHLFVDDMEDIIKANSAEQLGFWQSIRDFFDRHPYRLALLLAFSADAALLEAIVPEAVAERMSRPPLIFRALDKAEARAFLEAHMKAFRVRDEALGPFHPFTEEAVDVILDRTDSLIPRKMFRNFRAVIERAIQREGLAPDEAISRAMADQIMVSMGI